MTIEEYSKFQQELAVLLAKNGVTTYLLSVVTHDATDTQVPTTFNVVGSRTAGLTVSKVAAYFAESLVENCVRILMRFCGLSLHQAVGALRESVEAAALEIQRESVALAQSARDDDPRPE